MSRAPTTPRPNAYSAHGPTPASVKAWLADGKNISIDPRENGLFYIEMPWQERIYPHYGRYLRVESPRLLEFTWVSEGSLGKESVVLIELTARGAQTELTLTHDGLPDEEQAKSHHGGWSNFLMTRGQVEAMNKR